MSNWMPLLTFLAGLIIGGRWGFYTGAQSMYTYLLEHSKAMQQKKETDSNG